jgi:ADP-ribose pyrophosphatase
VPPRSDEPSRPWQTLSAERPVVTNWFAVRRDQVRTHAGDEITYTYVEHPGAIFIVPVTPHGEILLVRQYRYPVRAWCWETPAGSVQPGEEGAGAAARELREEIGGVAAEIKFIAAFYGATGMSTERAEVYLATNVELGESQPERTELLRVVPVALDEALRMAHAGEISDGQSALALLLCEPHLSTAQEPAT